MRFAKMRKFVLIVSRFSPAFAGAIKSAIGARKGKFKIPNIGRRAPEYREQSRRVRQGLKAAIFFARWQSFLIFQKTVSTLIFSSFYLLFRMRNFSRPPPPRKVPRGFLWAAQGAPTHNPGRANHGSERLDGNTHSARLDTNHTLRMLRLQPRITPARRAFSTLQTALFQ